MKEFRLYTRDDGATCHIKYADQLAPSVIYKCTAPATHVIGKGRLRCKEHFEKWLKKQSRKHNTL